jgi:hypothetical protein
VKVSKIAFHLTGENYNDTLIGTATFDVHYRWYLNWDTRSVPNGTYTLNGVAYDPAGNVGRSANMTITVHN